MTRSIDRRIERIGQMLGVVAERRRPPHDDMAKAEATASRAAFLDAVERARADRLAGSPSDLRNTSAAALLVRWTTFYGEEPPAELVSATVAAWGGLLIAMHDPTAPPEDRDEAIDRFWHLDDHDEARWAMAGGQRDRFVSGGTRTDRLAFWTDLAKRPRWVDPAPLALLAFDAARTGWEHRKNAAPTAQQGALDDTGEKAPNES